MTEQTTTTQGSAEALNLIDQIASHGEALALSLVANDHFKDLRPDFVAAMLDDLQKKFTEIQRLSQQ